MRLTKLTPPRPEAKEQTRPSSSTASNRLESLALPGEPGTWQVLRFSQHRRSHPTEFSVFHNIADDKIRHRGVSQCEGGGTCCRTRYAPPPTHAPHVRGTLTQNLPSWFDLLLEQFRTAQAQCRNSSPTKECCGGVFPGAPTSRTPALTLV